MWFGKGRNIVEKGGNADYQHFLLFPQCFLPNSMSFISHGFSTCEISNFHIHPMKLYFDLVFKQTFIFFVCTVLLEKKGEVPQSLQAERRALDTKISTIESNIKASKDMYQVCAVLVLVTVLLVRGFFIIVSVPELIIV